MLRAYMSDYYDIGRLGDMTEEQTIKHALGEALRRMGNSMQFESERHDVSIPKSIRIEVIKERWDLQVRLHIEEEEKDALP